MAALGVASGAAALTYTFLNLTQSGDNIVSARTVYGGTYNLLEHTLPQYGINTVFVDADVPGAFENAVDDKTKAKIKETSLLLYKVFGCRGLTRVDLFLQPDGTIVFNEVNTLPGFTDCSRYPRMLMAEHMTFGDIIRELLLLAIE